MTERYCYFILGLFESLMNNKSLAAFEIELSEAHRIDALLVIYTINRSMKTTKHDNICMTHVSYLLELIKAELITIQRNNEI